MRHAKQPSLQRKPRQMLPWAEGDLLKFYKAHGTGTGWHYGRVTRVDDNETTVKTSKHKLPVTLPHSEFERVQP